MEKLLRIGNPVAVRWGGLSFGYLPHPMNARVTRQGPHDAAFTLIELLTVIAIIATLMGLLFTAIFAAKNAARRAEAGVAVREIVSACKSYQTDYGKFPSVPRALIEVANGESLYAYGDIHEGKCAATNDVLFDVLRSISRGANSGHVLNRRKQTYLNTKVAADKGNPRSGFCDGREFISNQGQYMDPWGSQYCVVFSSSGDVSLDMGRFYADLSGAPGLLHVSAAAFSMGRDGKLGEKGSEGRIEKNTDDVFSWK